MSFNVSIKEQNCKKNAFVAVIFKAMQQIKGYGTVNRR